MSTSTFCSGPDHDRIKAQLPALLREKGITVEPRPGSSEQVTFRCTRGDVGAALTFSRVSIPAGMAAGPNALAFVKAHPFEVAVTAESTGWKFWRSGTAGQLEKDISDLIQSLLVNRPA